MKRRFRREPVGMFYLLIKYVSSHKKNEDYLFVKEKKTLLI
ncbi:hypothetical protein LEP1GSC168_2579 [Leptospira santarosai str. HAI134]|nr:hypothetical protein LEP1GSC169_1033 [Leptospira santarosai str. HAI1349]EMO22262.1 hypothetical protein LEP1GSC168_2579 [Leptospira santarosai str. HAI134]